MHLQAGEFTPHLAGSVGELQHGTSRFIRIPAVESCLGRSPGDGAREGDLPIDGLNCSRGRRVEPLHLEGVVYRQFALDEGGELLEPGELPIVEDVGGVATGGEWGERFNGKLFLATNHLKFQLEQLPSPPPQHRAIDQAVTIDKPPGATVEQQVERGQALGGAECGRRGRHGWGGGHRAQDQGPEVGEQGARGMQHQFAPHDRWAGAGPFGGMPAGAAQPGGREPLALPAD